jgi:purine-binding chemotaxis protein CheW
VRSVTSFYVDQWLLGLPSAEVREVLRQPWVTPVPLLPPAVRGVFSARGELVTVIDLRRRLGLPEGESEGAVHMILETPDGTVSLLVDRPGEVHSVPESAFEPPPANLAESARECLIGTYKLERELLLLLDSGRTLALPELLASDSAPQRAQESA